MKEKQGGSIVRPKDVTSNKKARFKKSQINKKLKLKKG